LRRLRQRHPFPVSADDRGQGVRRRLGDSGQCVSGLWRSKNWLR
jgi:hypothetical protein